MSNLINKILGNLATRIMFIIYLSIIFITTFFIVFGYYNELALQEQRQYDKLKAAVSSMAINMDGNEHLELMNRYTKDADENSIKSDSIYSSISNKLKEIVEVNGLNSPMYTLVYDEGDDNFKYGVRSDEYVDFKNPYTQSPDDLKELWEVGGTLPMYMSENGMWISAFHPIRTSNGDVIAVVEADIEFSEFSGIVNDEYLREVWISLAVILGLALFFIPYARKVLAKDERQRQIFLEQKKMIESKNRDITDSIKYALRIQSAMLPSLDVLNDNGHDGFIFHQAKDIVAGDFYWIEKQENYLFVAAADCTGHGVPGAIMSIICSNALNRVVDLMELRDTGEILDAVRSIIVSKIGNGDDGVSDGMDIALCRIELDTLAMQYTGANNPIYMHSVATDEITVGKPCKQPVGRYLYKKPFKSTDFQLSKGDMIFLFTDGFADQFGGPNGKKFKYKPFRALLHSLVQMETSEQKGKLRKVLRDWKGDIEQVDDICVLGIRI